MAQAPRQRQALGANATLPPGAYGQGGPNDVPVPKELLPLYQEASARTGIPVDVLIAQGRQESSFNPNAVGKAGEIGLGQIKPSTRGCARVRPVAGGPQQAERPPHQHQLPG